MPLFVSLWAYLREPSPSALAILKYVELLVEASRQPDVKVVVVVAAAGQTWRPSGESRPPGVASAVEVGQNGRRKRPTYSAPSGLNINRDDQHLSWYAVY